MYKVMALCLMVAFPVLSGIIELLVQPNSQFIEVFGRWFVFWGIGIRLFIAGVRQIAKPNLTSEGLLGIRGKEAWILVRELGLTNLGIGSIGILSLWIPGWSYAAALAGGIFLTLAGFEHIKKKRRNSDETTAMITDWVAGGVALIYLLQLVVVLLALSRFQ